MVKTSPRSVQRLDAYVREWSVERRMAAKLIAPRGYDRFYTVVEMPVQQPDESRQVYRARLRRYEKL